MTKLGLSDVFVQSSDKLFCPPRPPQKSPLCNFSSKVTNQKHTSQYYTNSPPYMAIFFSSTCRKILPRSPFAEIDLSQLPNNIYTHHVRWTCLHVIKTKYFFSFFLQLASQAAPSLDKDKV